MAASSLRLWHAQRDAGLATDQANLTFIAVLDRGRVNALDTELSATEWGVAPAGRASSLVCRSAAATVCLWQPSKRVIASLQQEYSVHIARRAWTTATATAQTLPLTVWVRELWHRFVFERLACDRPDSLAARFLEVELCKEWFFGWRDRHADVARANHLTTGSPLLRRALPWIEERLEARLTLPSLARAIGASPRSVQRAFTHELGLSVTAYVRDRRLELALTLLRTQQYQVAEVARRVGYQNVSAFTQAFKARFGALPSASLSANTKPAPKPRKR